MQRVTTPGMFDKHLLALTRNISRTFWKQAKLISAYVIMKNMVISGAIALSSPAGCQEHTKIRERYIIRRQQPLDAVLPSVTWCMTVRLLFASEEGIVLSFGIKALFFSHSFLSLHTVPYLQLST